MFEMLTDTVTWSFQKLILSVHDTILPSHMRVAFSPHPFQYPVINLSNTTPSDLVKHDIP